MSAVDTSCDMVDLIWLVFTTTAIHQQPLTIPMDDKFVSSMVHIALWDHQGIKQELPLPIPEALAAVAAVTDRPEAWGHFGIAGLFQLAARHYSARLQTVLTAGTKLYSRGQGPSRRLAVQDPGEAAAVVPILGHAGYALHLNDPSVLLLPYSPFASGLHT